MIQLPMFIIRLYWRYIKGECKLTNTNYHGNSSTDGYWELSKNEIISNWVKELGL
jgi:hypothetical protein